jgi:AbrB family looped-hinge helix DNA binding protein
MTVWEATLSSKGQMTVPKELREALNLRPGDQLICSVIDGEILITPKNIDLRDLVGYLGSSPNGAATLAEIDAAVVAAVGASVLKTDDDDTPDVAA